MTILNCCTFPDQVALVADTAIAETRDITAKVLALPHLGAIAGAAGSLELWIDVVRLLLGGLPAGATVADLAATLPEFLCERWQRTGGHPSSIVLAGGIGEDVQAWIFHSPHFAARRLGRGVWLMPGILEDVPAATQPPADPGSRSDRPDEASAPAPPEPWPHDWPASMRIMMASVRKQREQRRVHSGGSLEILVVTPNTLHGWRDELLDFEGPCRA